MSAPWAASTFSHKGDKWRNEQDVALFAYSRGSSTAVMLNDDEHVSRDRGLLPEVVRGNAVVRGRLSVHRLLPPGSGRSDGRATVTAMLGWLEQMSVQIAGHSTATAGDMMMGVEQTLSGRADGTSTVGDGIDETWLEVVPDPLGRARPDPEDIARQAARQRRAFVRSSGRTS